MGGTTPSAGGCRLPLRPPGRLHQRHRQEDGALGKVDEESTTPESSWLSPRGSVSVGLDAAHIRWHQAGGPDREGNGLALCVLHHKLFDLGAFTVSPSGLLLVSDQ